MAYFPTQSTSKMMSKKKSPAKAGTKTGGMKAAGNLKNPAINKMVPAPKSRRS